MIFINGIYRISVPFLLILPAIIHALQISSPPEASAGKPALGHQDNAGVLILLLVLISIGIAGYRPYATGSNLPHYTNLFLKLILIPTAVGTVGSALALVFIRQKPPTLILVAEDSRKPEASAQTSGRGEHGPGADHNLLFSMGKTQHEQSRSKHTPHDKSFF